jgi:hypothetical protein
VLVHAASDDHGDAFQALRTAHTGRFKLQILLPMCEPGEGELECMVTLLPRTTSNHVNHVLGLGR